MSSLAIIGIRSGSQEVKDKNIKLFCGKPLVHWAIQVAKKSKKIDRIIVSTDSEKYRDIVLESGAEAPFLRPDSISKSESREVDFIIHCLDWLRDNEGYVPNLFSRLAATSPLQLPDDVDRSIECLENDKRATSSMVVSETSQPPLKALKMDEDNKYLINYFSEADKGVVNRQELIPAYFRSNVITTRVSNFLKTGEQIGKKSIKVEISDERSIDINSELDFYLAEKIAEKFGLCLNN
jgi:CMP-N-acetylneuraminic acid synthetase